MQTDRFNSPNPPASHEKFHLSDSFETLEKFDCLGEFVDFAGGEALFFQGDPCTMIYVLTSGNVKISVIGLNGRKQVIGMVPQGEMFGLSAALGDGIHEMTAEAAGFCSTRAIKTRSIMNLISANPRACVRAAQAVIRSQRILGSSQLRMGLSTTSAARVARLLLEWAGEQNSVCGSPRRCTLRFTRSEMASMCATTRETLVRILSKFAREKLIAIHGVALTILNPSALETIADY